MATASELFECRHYASAVATCSSALEAAPHTVAYLLLRARCFIALRRTADAQADLGDVIRLDPRCGIAYRLLGELAARRDENESAAIFFREALRLDAGDGEARDWLVVVDGANAPRTNRTPRPATAGNFPVTHAPIETPRTASGARTLSAPARLARGTAVPEDGRPLLARGSARNGHLFTPGPELVDDGSSRRPVDRGAKTVAERAPSAPLCLSPDQFDDEPKTARMGSHAGAIRASHTVAVSDVPSLRAATPRPATQPALKIGFGLDADLPEVTIPGRPPATPPARPAPRMATKPFVRQQTPELPGFAEYLVTEGILTRERLRAAQAYQRSMKVQLATAIVTLGLASPQRIEYASVSHRSATHAKPAAE